MHLSLIRHVTLWQAMLAASFYLVSQARLHVIDTSFYRAAATGQQFAYLYRFTFRHAPASFSREQPGVFELVHLTGHNMLSEAFLMDTHPVGELCPETQTPSLDPPSGTEGMYP